jgi:uncharacterized protein (TIGR02145 family)
MEFNRLSLRPLATFAVGLVVLVACQNATDSNTNSDSPLVVTAKFPISAPRVPDTATSFIQNDSVSNKLNCPPTSGSEDSTTCTATLDLPHPLGTDSVALQLWTLGVETYTLYFRESGSSTTLDLGSHSVLSLDTLLLSGFANLPAAQKSTFGTGPSGLVAYYASLLLANDAAFVGKSLPVGMSIDSVKKDLVLQGIPAGKTPTQLAALSVGLDTASIRNIAAILVQANLLKSTDTLDWFHPVRVSAAVSIASSLTAGGGAVNVNGAFSWNAGASVTLSRITVRTPNPGDSSTVQLSYQFNIGKTDTVWSLSSNLTLQAKSSASVGWDTLLIILSTDSTHSVTARVPFQVVAKDVTPPALILLSPAQDTASVPNSTASFVVKALATDSGSGMDSLKIGTKTYRTAATIADTLWDTLSLVVGANVATVQAWDHEGNTSSATVTITRAPAPVNTKPPSITQVTPSQDTETVPWSTKSAILSWAITGDTTISTVTLNGHPLTGHAGLYQDTAILGMGPNLFILAAADAYGLGAFDTLRITRQGDTSHPLVSRGSGTNDTVLLKNQSTYSPTWTVTDNALDSVTINGVAATAGNGNTYSAPVTLSGDSLWITLVAKDSSGNTTKDSIKVRRLALVNISGAGTYFSGNQIPSATLSSNLPGARIGSSLDRVNWTPYPVGGITISKNEILYAQDTVGAVVSGIDSAAFLYIPTPTLSGITATQATVTIAPAGSPGIEDSLSTGTSWSSYSTLFSIGGNCKVFARSHLGTFVTAEQELDFAQAPTLTPSAKDTGVDSVMVSVSGAGADSVQVSLNQLKWFTVSGSRPSYLMTASGILYGRSWVGSVVSAVDSVSVSFVPSSPRFSVVGGAYLTPQTVALATVPTGANIYYTTDGSTPNTKSTLYTKPITVGSTTTLKSIAANGAAVNSLVDSALYAIADTNTYGIPWNPAITYGTLWDTRDNQVYRTVIIGTQTWMAQNLNISHISNTPVDTVGTCYNYSQDSCLEYGRLYTWAEAMGVATTYNTTILSPTLPAQGLCPRGWHVPSNSEWKTLQSTVDSVISGTNLKSIFGWSQNDSASGNGTDSFGFRTLPTGHNTGGSFGGIGNDADFWSASEYGTSSVYGAVGAWMMYVYNAYSFIELTYNYKSSGYSLRCLEN